jgi:hypothetical protein
MPKLRNSAPQYVYEEMPWTLGGYKLKRIGTWRDGSVVKSYKTFTGRFSEGSCYATSVSGGTGVYPSGHWEHSAAFGTYKVFHESDYGQCFDSEDVVDWNV